MNRFLIIASCAFFFSEVWAQEVFNSVVVHTHEGQVHTYSITEVDSISVSPELNVQRCKWYHTLESPGIADYLRDFEYDANDYSYHRIFDYRGEPYLDKRQDWPYGVTLGDSTYYNLIPGRTYTLNYWHQGVSKPTKIQTLGQLRQIKLQNIRNVRDMGGWPTLNGKHLKYGLLYRGPQLNETSMNDRELMRNLLEVRAELDLRNTNETTRNSSILGDDIVYARYNLDYSNPNSESNKPLYINCLRFIISNLRENRPVYLHCVYGADRTGLMAMLLEGLLGVSQSDMDKDYELTSFSGNTRYRTNTNYRKGLTMVLLYTGSDTQEKFRKWWLSIGATEAELDEFIELMTE